MTERLNAIVLGTVRHSDRSDITTFYTRERGRLALAVGAGSGRNARQRRGQLMPLSLVELTACLEAGREVGRLSGLSPIHIPAGILSDPVKTTVGMFVTEFIGKLVRESPPDSALWDYLSEAIRLLDSMPSGRGVGNYPIALLSTLTAFVGIAPDISGWNEGALFDMRGGVFTDKHPGHTDMVEGDESAIVRLLGRISFANSARLRLNRDDRRRTLKGLLRYYAIHLPGTGGMKSPEVLAEVLG